MRFLTRPHLRDTPEKSADLCPFPFPFQIWVDGDGCRDNVSPPGVGYRLAVPIAKVVPLRDTRGPTGEVITTVLQEIDREAANEKRRCSARKTS